MTETVSHEPIRAHWVSRAQIVDEIAAAGAEFVDLLRSLPGHGGATPVPHLDWTVAETAAHMVSVLRRALGDSRRARSLPELAELNAVGVDEVAERGLARLADLMEDDLAAVAGVLPIPPDNFVVDLHAGLRADLTTGASYILADLQVHAWDIAVAAGRPWTIDPDRARTTVLTVFPAAGPWLKPAVRTGPPRAVALALGDGADPLVVEAGRFRYSVSRRVPGDVAVVDADPADVILAFPGRVQSANPAVAELCGWFLPI